MMREELRALAPRLARMCPVLAEETLKATPGISENPRRILRGLIIRGLLVVRATREGLVLRAPGGTPVRPPLIPSVEEPPSQPTSFLGRFPDSLRPHRLWVSGIRGPRRILGLPRGWSALAEMNEVGRAADGAMRPLHGILRLLGPDMRAQTLDFSGCVDQPFAPFPARFRMGSAGVEMLLDGKAIVSWTEPDNLRAARWLAKSCIKSRRGFRHVGVNIHQEEGEEGEGDALHWSSCSIDNPPSPEVMRSRAASLLDRERFGMEMENDDQWNLLVAAGGDLGRLRVEAIRDRPYLLEPLASRLLPSTLESIDAGRPFLAPLARELGVPRSFASLPMPGMKRYDAQWMGAVLCNDDWRRMFALFWAALQPGRAALEPCKSAACFMSGITGNAPGFAEERIALARELASDLPKTDAKAIPDGYKAEEILDAARSVGEALHAAAGVPFSPSRISSVRLFALACRLFRGRRRVTWDGLIRMCERWHEDDVQAFLSARSVQLLEGLGAAPSPTGSALEELQGGTARWLLSPRDLAGEGEEMQHCVASHAGSVLSARSVVASLCGAGGARATAEFVRTPDGGWRCGQLRGRHNAPPAEETLGLAEALEQMLARPHPAFADFVKARDSEPPIAAGPRGLLFRAGVDPGAAMDFLRRFGLLHPRLRGTPAGALLEWAVQDIGRQGA